MHEKVNFERVDSRRPISAVFVKVFTLLFTVLSVDRTDAGPSSSIRNKSVDKRR